MSVYLMNNAIILLAGIIFFLGRKTSKKNIEKNIYLIFVGLILIMIAGFRGDFTSDYIGYERIFNFHNQFNDFGTLMSNRYSTEIGFIFLNWLVGRVTDKVIWIFLINSMIIVTLYFKEFKEYSTNVCLSVLLFVTIGGYYISFNIMRQVLSAAIIFAGSSYLYERRMWKFFVVVVLASLIHTTSLIMIPFYFILNLKFNYKKLFFVLLSFVVVSSNINIILEFIQQYFYAHYQESSYGMTGFGYLLKSHKEDNKMNVWFNASIFYIFFSFLGLNVQMLERLSIFFSPYVLLLIPRIATSEKSKQLRIVYFFAIVLGSILYNYSNLNGSGYDPYYFIWNR